jgi:hypothetical protein
VGHQHSFESGDRYRNHSSQLSGAPDPIIPMAQRGLSSRAIIDACRPYEWLKDFPPVAESTGGHAAEEKWGKILLNLPPR